MKTSSFWVDSAQLPRFSKLDKNLAVDVVVIGAGITGITAAYLLKKAGQTVALVERERCGGVDSSFTTAHLTCVTDERLSDLVKNFGKQRAKAIWDAGLAAIDQIVRNIRDENISCEFIWVPGYLHAPLRSSDASERETLKRDAGFAKELGIQAEFLEEVPYFKSPGVKFLHQAKFHPLKYLSALLRTIPGNGSHVFERTEISGVEAKPLSVLSGENKIRCRYIVLATHTPLMGKTNIVSATLLQTKLYLYTSYVLGARVEPGILPEASFWDTDDPYHYLRVDRRRGFDYLIFGGEDHKTGQKADSENCFRKLEKTLRRMAPRAEVDHYWSGQVVETNDGLPFIGETSENQFAATGFAGNGMTFGTLSAMMAVDSFLKRKNPWADLFSPRRKKIRGGLVEYLRENKDYPYYLVRDRLPGRVEGKSLRSLQRNEGKILNLKGHKVAAYRSAQGEVALCSPVCTHLGCIVGWNDAEKTWDCPCHGSRFKPTGEVLAGPAESDLTKIDEQE